MIQGKDIYEGRYIWYGGETFLNSWDCPARIIDVDSNTRTFRVVSLDDGREQGQRYSFDVDDQSPGSRKSMRIVDVLEIEEYLKKRIHSIDIKNVQLEIEIKKNKQKQQEILKEIDKLLAKDSTDPY